MSTIKRVYLTLTDTTLPQDQQAPQLYLVEMPDDYDPAIVTYEDVLQDNTVRIIDGDILNEEVREARGTSRLRSTLDAECAYYHRMARA